ncbi:hypothetical protein [Polaromonas sp. CG_9.11]|uniref:hypothetical protein n=1 Tax=Polaromonas sp. CG_9.11 TaxID=2787730 RepID=UPI0018CBA304|nr:hypothetical protein [Polaromonas sp. CG_9.11]MBG6076223.1 hypothetical protein [Polaromonas sp. CG_9.11]
MLEIPTPNSASNSATRDDRPLKSAQLLEMFHGLYATFTICTLEGKVVCCADVFGKQEGSKASREMKKALLLDCGIVPTS